jgi:hypothetical protein
MLRAILWVAAQCNLVEVYLRFGGTYRLYLQGRRIGHESIEQEVQNL